MKAFQYTASISGNYSIALSAKVQRVAAIIMKRQQIIELLSMSRRAERAFLTAETQVIGRGHLARTKTKPLVLKSHLL